MPTPTRPVLIWVIEVPATGHRPDRPRPRPGPGRRPPAMAPPTRVVREGTSGPSWGAPPACAEPVRDRPHSRPPARLSAADRRTSQPLRDRTYCCPVRVDQEPRGASRNGPDREPALTKPGVDCEHVGGGG